MTTKPRRGGGREGLSGWTTKKKNFFCGFPKVDSFRTRQKFMIPYKKLGYFYG